MSGWAQRDAERKEEEAMGIWDYEDSSFTQRDAENMQEILRRIDDVFIVNWVKEPFSYSAEEYMKALAELHKVWNDEAIYFEHQRLIKLNEDFYGPVHKEEDVPFV